MDVSNITKTGLNIVNNLLIIRNKDNDDYLGLYIFTSSSGLPTRVGAVVPRDLRSKYGGASVYADVAFKTDCIAMDVIFGGQKTGFGSVLMKVMCIIGHARGLSQFEVGNVIDGGGWDRHIASGFLVFHQDSDYRCSIDAMDRYATEHATGTGWDLDQLENLTAHIEVISQPDPKLRKPTKRTCNVM